MDRMIEEYIYIYIHIGRWDTQTNIGTQTDANTQTYIEQSAQNRFM